MCQPSPTVVQLPLPNNTDVQQVGPQYDVKQKGDSKKMWIKPFKLGSLDSNSITSLKSKII